MTKYVRFQVTRSESEVFEIELYCYNPPEGRNIIEVVKEVEEENFRNDPGLFRSGSSVAVRVENVEIFEKD